MWWEDHRDSVQPVQVWGHVGTRKSLDGNRVDWPLGSRKPITGLMGLWHNDLQPFGDQCHVVLWGQGTRGYFLCGMTGSAPVFPTIHGPWVLGQEGKSLRTEGEQLEAMCANCYSLPGNAFHTTTEFKLLSPLANLFFSTNVVWLCLPAVSLDLFFLLMI